MTFDAKSLLDPFQRGFRALESLNEETVAPETGLVPDDRRDGEIITYVRQGTLIQQDGSGKFVRLETGEFHRANAWGGRTHLGINGSLTERSIDAKVRPAAPGVCTVELTCLQANELARAT